MRRGEPVAEHVDYLKAQLRQLLPRFVSGGDGVVQLFGVRRRTVVSRVERIGAEPRALELYRDGRADALYLAVQHQVDGLVVPRRPVKLLVDDLFREKERERHGARIFREGIAVRRAHEIRGGGKVRYAAYVGSLRPRKSENFFLRYVLLHDDSSPHLFFDKAPKTTKSAAREARQKKFRRACDNNTRFSAPPP